MSDTSLVTAEPTADEVGAVLGKLMSDFSATVGTLLSYLGGRLGLWDAIATAPASVESIAERSALAVPYVREWLRSQTAAGYVDYDIATGRYGVSPAVAVVFSGPLSGLPDGAASQFQVYWSELERWEAAFRSGDGIAWADLPAEHSAGMDRISRAVVVPSLLGEWLPALHGVVERLESGGAVADVCCGYGAPTLAMAEAFPAASVIGIDIDDASIARARRAAQDAGWASRVRFEVAAATELWGGPYDLVTFVDALHDLGDPVGALRAVRSVLADDGTVLVVEHAGSDRLEENLNPVGRFFYASSMLVCTPNALSQHGEPLGCIAGEAAIRAVAGEAGFGRIRVLDVGGPLNTIFEVRR